MPSKETLVLRRLYSSFTWTSKSAVHFFTVRTLPKWKVWIGTTKRKLRPQRLSNYNTCSELAKEYKYNSHYSFFIPYKSLFVKLR